MNLFILSKTVQIIEPQFPTVGSSVYCIKIYAFFYDSKSLMKKYDQLPNNRRNYYTISILSQIRSQEGICVSRKQTWRSLFSSIWRVLCSVYAKLQSILPHKKLIDLNKQSHKPEKFSILEHSFDKHNACPIPNKCCSLLIRILCRQACLKF